MLLHDVRNDVLAGHLPQTQRQDFGAVVRRVYAIKPGAVDLALGSQARENPEVHGKQMLRNLSFRWDEGNCFGFSADVKLASRRIIHDVRLHPYIFVAVTSAPLSAVPSGLGEIFAGGCDLRTGAMSSVWRNKYRDDVCRRS